MKYENVEITSQHMQAPSPSAYLFFNGSAIYFDEKGNQIPELQKAGISALRIFKFLYPEAKVHWSIWMEKSQEMSHEAIQMLLEHISLSCDWCKIEYPPPHAGHYLVALDWMGVVEKGEFDGKDRWLTPWGGNPTHWMNLPDAPKEAWYKTEEGKKKLLELLNQRFYFHKDGTITEREEK